MLFNIGKLRLFFYASDRDRDTFPAPFIGLGYFGHWYGSTLLATLHKRIYYGPQLALYFFIGPKIVEISAEWKISRPATVYETREDVRESLREKLT
jgi:hypothetical protein